MSPSELQLQVGRRSVRISHPDKVLFPDDGIAKLDLAEYYATIAPTMVGHVRDRPMNLWRWNTGIDGPRIVQQEIPKGAPEWVRRVTVPKRGGGEVSHAVGGEAGTLVWMANQNCITPHIWSSRSDRPDRPDRIVFDLDPPDLDAFGIVRDAARALGDTLRGVGLVPFVMTTGSKGLHVVAPLRRTNEADEVRERAREIGEEVAERFPDTLTTSWRKEGRAGRVLVDTARNTYAQTVVAPYAVRAIPGAPVATPIEWHELDDANLHPRRWTLHTIPARIRERGDPWADINKAAAALRI